MENREREDHGSAATHCYAAGWRPESGLRETADDLLDIIFDADSTVEECEMAATTLVELVHPEVLQASLPPEATDGICDRCGCMLEASRSIDADGTVMYYACDCAA